VSEREPLYHATVEAVFNRQRLIMLTGSRETVLDAALRVMLDCAPAWHEPNAITPMFQVNVQRVDP
jgi:hypothetical protein